MHHDSATNYQMELGSVIGPAQAIDKDGRSTMQPRPQVPFWRWYWVRTVTKDTKFPQLLEGKDKSRKRWGDVDGDDRVANESTAWRKRI